MVSCLTVYLGENNVTKILISADLHIHAHKKSYSRLQDCLNALEWIFITTKERCIKNIILSGDVFHDRQKIEILTYQRVFEIFKKYLEGTNRKVYLLLGNHDLWHLQKWDISSIFPLTGIPNVQVIDKPCTIDIDGFPISFLPFTTDPLSELSKIKNTHKPRVLFSHLAINGAIMNTMHGVRSNVSVEHDSGMMKLDTNIFQSWDFVFLGHYHAAQKLDFNVEYIGSPLQLSFGEAFQHKNIIVFDTDTLHKEYVRNTFSPQHFIIPKKDIEKYEIKNNFIQVMVNESIPASDIIELRNDLVKQGVGSFEVVNDLKPQEQMQVIEDAKSILLDQSKMMEEYVKECRKTGKVSDDLTDDALFNTWQKIIEKSAKRE